MQDKGKVDPTDLLVIAELITNYLAASIMDSKALFLTANTTSVYQMAWLQLKDEPMVIETPPDVLGIIDDHWFKYVADFGRLGPDQGKGGKFLILPPGYDEIVPKGYHVVRTNTYGNWVIWRGFQVDGSPKPAVETTQKTFPHLSTVQEEQLGSDGSRQGMEHDLPSLWTA